MKRETYWIKILSPYYNILKIGYSSLGYKHTEKIKEFLSKIAKNRIVSEETKLKISENTKGRKNPFFGKTHTKEILQKIQINNSFLVPHFRKKDHKNKDPNIESKYFWKKLNAVKS